MPPSAVRRPITVTVWLVMSIVCLALSPVLLALAALASAVSGRPRALIFAELVVAYFALELATLIACGALWLASGGGVLMGTEPFQRLHYRLLRWFVHGFATRWSALLEIDVPPPEPGEATRALESDRPLLFFSRHAGPGDTILLIDRLLTRFDRLPSVVFKQSVAFDPCVDLIGHRLPHAVLDTSDQQECERRIEEVAAGLRGHGVLLLFPEGGNFTAERRHRAVGKLWRTGRRREAARAEHMSHVLPPRPTGALAALRGNPRADVIFGAHSGLGLAAFPREIWHAMPLRRTFATHMWLSPAAERPIEPEVQVRWLYDWWKRLDEWIEQHGTEPQSTHPEGSPDGRDAPRLSLAKTPGRTRVGDCRELMNAEVDSQSEQTEQPREHS
jgi:1-acyl-sn-glycerol-3-phosphate acyltransferase